MLALLPSTSSTPLAPLLLLPLLPPKPTGYKRGARRGENTSTQVRTERGRALREAPRPGEGTPAGGAPPDGVQPLLPAGRPGRAGGHAAVERDCEAGADALDYLRAGDLLQVDRGRHGVRLREGEFFFFFLNVCVCSCV